MVAIVRERLTPEYAEQLLQKNVLNRKISPKGVLKLAQQMKAGCWEDNGDTIKISRTGVLLDGQHRLAAIVYSNVTVTTNVAYDVPDSAFHTIDTNRPRKAGDVLTLEGYSSGVHLADGGGTLWKVFSGVPRATPVPMPYLAEVIDRYPSLPSYAVQSRDPSIRRLIPASVFLPAMVYLCDIAQRAPDLGARFVNGMVKGDGLKDGDPILAYRNRIMRYRLDRNAKADASTMWPITVRLIDALEDDDRSVYKMVMNTSTGPMERPKRFSLHVLSLPVNQRMTDLISGEEITSRESVGKLVERVSSQAQGRRRKA